MIMSRNFVFIVFLFSEKIIKDKGTRVARVVNYYMGYICLLHLI